MSVTDVHTENADGGSHRNRLFIGGAWRDGAERSTIEVINPSDGSVITTVGDATVEDACTTVDAAAEAAEEWGARALTMGCLNSASRSTWRWTGSVHQGWKEWI